MSDKCSKQCVPNNEYGKMVKMLMAILALCENDEEKSCYSEAKKAAKDQVIKTKSCTKIQYKTISHLFRGVEPHNKAAYKIQFATPPKVKVREEYLVYGMLELISSVGGAFGLCVGFSFYSLVNAIIGLILKGMEQLTNGKSNKVKEVMPKESTRSIGDIEKEFHLKTTQLGGELKEMKTEMMKMSNALKEMEEKLNKSVSQEPASPATKS